MTILMFTASWCAPCKTMKDFVGDRVTMIDVGEEPDEAQKFGVRAVPTFVKVDGPNVLDIRQGAMSEAAFNQWVNA